MSDEEDKKRLFFGAKVQAPWPLESPKGRVIDEATRHMTLAFLGQNSFSRIEQLLPSIPKPEFEIGPAGVGRELVFLPPQNSRVAAIAVNWLDDARLNIYQKALADWLKDNGYPIDERPFFPHVTIARAPFDKEEWTEQFSPLPVYVQGIHLYESLGNLQYRSLWECPLLSPFEEFEHTADIAYIIRGSNVNELHLNAQIALAFHFPRLIDFFTPGLKDSLDEIIIALNEMVSKADAVYGCPFKAVSFHGEIEKKSPKRLQWEMIVDV